jgi:cardiolipin synthase
MAHVRARPTAVLSALLTALTGLALISVIAGCGTTPAGTAVAPTTAAPTTAAPTAAAPTTAAPPAAPPTAAAPTPSAPITAPPAAAPPTTAPPPATAPSPTVPPQVIVEPNDGIGPIDTLLASPQHQLDLVMYELVDPTAVGILEADAARGVTVRVVLDQNRERAANTPAYDALAAHGIHVVWASTAFEATHEKAFVIDAGTPGAEAVIMTLNLTSRYYADTRDVAVVDPDPTDVAAVEATFAADFAAAGTGAAPAAAPSPDLVWSPGSAPALLALIGSATKTLAVENEEMSDAAVVAALSAAARRGVAVTVVLTDGDDYASELAELQAAGVTVRLLPDRSSVLYIHAKVIVADDSRAFVGSENFSSASLERDRELGVVLSDPSVAATLAAMIATDAANPAATQP